MKKVFSTLLVAGIIALVACGPSAEEKAATETPATDSMEATMAAPSEPTATTDSAAMAAPATTDSATAQ